ncbi:MAG: Tetratricopeptide 2 repeat protein [Myxococcales bacterium]|nr:Tetratricopeptide 2 repeat protein [Myxococcales bacterium]
MRGHAASVGSVDIFVRAVLEEFPELDAARVRAALERGVARAASASLDTEGYRVVDLHLARVEASEESTERAEILRSLSENLEERGDADRALVVRLSAFTEASAAGDVDPLLRLARLTDRWSELPLDTMNALIDINDDGAAQRLTAMADAWQRVERPYYAADCLERVLLIKPADAHANEALELFYRSVGEWPVLIDLLSRHTLHLVDDKQRAERFREMGEIYERELGDDAGALDSYRESDQLAPGHPDVLDAISRLAVKVGVPDEEAIDALERLAALSKLPADRAKVLCRAAELARLYDYDRAQRLFERARADDPDHAGAIDGFVQLHRDRGQLAEAVKLLLEGAARPGLAKEKSRWLTDAAGYCVALGDTTRAEKLYREARVANPDNHEAGLALVELCLDTGSLVELAPILDELCRTTDDPGRLRGYLLQRAKLSSELGDKTGARQALTRAVDLDPADTGARRELADMLYDAGQWAKARPLLESLLEDEDLLPPERRVELHYKVAHCAFEVSDKDASLKHLGITLAIVPDHRDALKMRMDLDAADPFAHAAGQLALANLAPPEEKATRFAALGDRYTELGDRATAREMYREALAHRPGDHLLLTKFLGLVTEDGDWSYSLDVVQRLIDTEADRKVRARYRHLAGMIARDELEDHEQAVAWLTDAVEDDPLGFTAADELEQLLASSPDADALIRFYYRRLEHVRTEEGRAGERLRLWDQLGELCLQLNRPDDAVTAFEVGLTLAPDDLGRRQRLADLYFGNPAQDANAIAAHQAVLRAERRRVESYKALRDLYKRTQQPEKARACDAAIELVESLEERIDKLFEPSKSLELASASRAFPAVAGRVLTNEDFVALSRLDVDLGLSTLFAIVAPTFGVERARMRPPAPVPAKESELPETVARVLAQVVTAFAVKRPPVYIEKDQPTLCRLAMRAREGVLTPVLTLGKPALAKDADEKELAFLLSRQLADLRTDRIARLLCPRAGELAQIIELASAPAGDSTSHAARWLTSSLHPVELDQAMAIGARLRERGVHPMSAALSWLAATDRAADRIGFVIVGDLVSCARMLEREPQASTADATRVLDLVWSSVTEEVLTVRSRLESWVTEVPARRKTATLSSLEPR